MIYFFKNFSVTIYQPFVFFLFLFFYLSVLFLSLHLFFLLLYSFFIYYFIFLLFAFYLFFLFFFFFNFFSFVNILNLMITSSSPEDQNIYLCKLYRNIRIGSYLAVSSRSIADCLPFGFGFCPICNNGYVGDRRVYYRNSGVRGLTT